MNTAVNLKKFLFLSALRLMAIVAVSLSIAAIVSSQTYKDYYSKRLFQLHTSDLATLANNMTVKLNFFLSQGNREGVQSVLDASFGLFGFIITDCKVDSQTCPDQKIISTSDLSLPWVSPPRAEDIHTNSFALLRKAPGVFPENGSSSLNPAQAGEIIGRLYVKKNMPQSFSIDYLEYLKSPFMDVGVRRLYLSTTLSFLAGSLIFWTITELYLKLRRKQKLVLQQRELELRQSVNRQMKELAEKDAQITRLNEQSSRQYEAYLEKIRSLNYKVQNEEEYRDFAEQIIVDLEKDKALDAAKYAEELSQVRQDMERLMEKVAQFETSTKSQAQSTYKALEEAVRTPKFSNVFEQQIFDVIASSEQYKKGEWRLVSNFDVAPGRNYRQFTDFILFNKDALIILEAKYYVGLIDSPGDFLNDIWISAGTQRKKIDCLWGENPYHQLNEYSMSLMKILKQKSPWNFQIFGVIIFPDDADISKVGEHLGKFYRITTLSKALPLFAGIFAESARFQAAKNPKRPKAAQVEDMLRGRKLSA